KWAPSQQAKRLTRRGEGSKRPFQLEKQTAFDFTGRRGRRGELRVAAIEEVLSDERRFEAALEMPGIARVQRRVSRHGGTGERPDVPHHHVELLPPGKIERRAQVPLMSRVISCRGDAGRIAAARLET